MKKNNELCPCRSGCGIIGSVLGIVIGIITAIFFALGYIPLILNGIWVALGIGGATLLYVLIAPLFILRISSTAGNFVSCFCKYGRCLLIGAIGTVLSALAAVSITLDISVIAIIALIGTGTFFLVFAISALIEFVKCLIAGACK